MHRLSNPGYPQFGDKPADPEQERRFWYQFYFNTERGRKGLTQMRSEIGKLIWRQWSPNWAFDDEIYRRTAKSFDNPDFVDVVIHSYRHRIRNAASDPRYAPIEAQLAAQPKINVPTVVIHGSDDEVNPAKRSEGTIAISLVTTSAASLPMSGTIHHKKPRKNLPSRFLISVGEREKPNRQPAPCRGGTFPMGPNGLARGQRLELEPTQTRLMRGGPTKSLECREPLGVVWERGSYPGSLGHQNES